MATKSKHYDAIIVGGGHNGLTNGAYLAKAGLKVLIIERRHLVGGAAITEELYPGFSFTTFLQPLTKASPHPLLCKALKVTKKPLRKASSLYGSVLSLAHLFNGFMLP